MTDGVEQDNRTVRRVMRIVGHSNQLRNKDATSLDMYTHARIHMHTQTGCVRRDRCRTMQEGRHAVRLTRAYTDRVGKVWQVQECTADNRDLEVDRPEHDRVLLVHCVDTSHR